MQNSYLLIVFQKYFFFAYIFLLCIECVKEVILLRFKYSYKVDKPHNITYEGGDFMTATFTIVDLLLKIGQLILSYLTYKKLH